MRHILLALFCTTIAGAAPWADGTEIVRFDKREACQMDAVADWTGAADRPWPGPTLWANRTMDWCLRQHQFFGVALVSEAVNTRPCRAVHLLTEDLADQPGPFRMEVLLTNGGPAAGFAGFLVGAGEGRLDYRGAALVHNSPGKGGGLLAVVDTVGDGGLSFRDMAGTEFAVQFPLLEGRQTIAKEPIRLDYHQLTLNLEGIPQEGGTYDLRLTVWARNSGDLLGACELPGVPASRLLGNVGLVSHGDGKPVRHAFGDFKVGGERFVKHPERTFGPVAGTLYSVSGGTLKLSAQFMDLGEALLPPQKGRPGRPRMAARLDIRPAGSNGEWRTVVEPQGIAGPDYCVLFRVEPWDSTKDWETRVVTVDGAGVEHSYQTLVGHDPVERPSLRVAAFTGMGTVGRTVGQMGPKPGPGEVLVGRWTPANVWMPFQDCVTSVEKQNVDLLFFTGDQIYEGKPTPIDGGREPYRDYLYKWLLWHWSFNELTRRMPSICQPDDHDVYHGNLWGWGGKLNTTGFNGGGGYLCSPSFVNVVHRTQTVHNPDAYDPVPLTSGITNYYGGFTYGGVGFAVLEDRKFKVPGAVQDPAQQVLLGAKQLQFLKEWGEDWSGQKFKVVVSQTIYAGMHVAFDGTMAKDTDTDGWPKVGRDRAVKLFQRCGALIVSGDQHLGTFGRLGLDAPSDAVYQLCTPAVGNIFWRWFYPEQPGADRQPGEPDYAGEFVDAWGNYFRMIAVANPERKDLLSHKLRQRYVIPEEEAKNGLGDELKTAQGDGYATIVLDKQAQTIEVADWPNGADPQAGDKPFTGWPVTLRLEDLDGRRPVAWLPDLKIAGQPDPVVQLIDQASGELIKVTRARDGAYRPGVFDPALTYTVRVGEPGRGAWWERRDLRPTAEPGASTLEVELR